MIHRRGQNLGGRYNRLTKHFRIPEEKPIIEMIWGPSDNPHFGLTVFPDDRPTLPYPLSYPHLNPALGLPPPWLDDDDEDEESVQPEPQPEPEPPPPPKPPRRVADPVLYHHFRKYQEPLLDPPLWETHSTHPLHPPEPPLLDSAGRLPAGSSLDELSPYPSDRLFH